MRRLLFFLFLLTSVRYVNAQAISMREQSRVIDEILADRFNNLLPSLMERNGIDLWVIVSREYNEDPVIRTFLPATWFAARRRTMLLIYKPQGTKKVEALAVTEILK